MIAGTVDAPLWSPRTIGLVVAAGIAIGVCYVLSPLTVLCALAAVPLYQWAVGGLEGEERRWLIAILATAAVTRVLVILALFLITNHQQVPFGSLFGDEEYFIRRSLWMRNVAIGLPMHRADFVYAYDDYSRTSFLYVLAALQVLVGPAPYGAHLFSILCYLVASVVLYRLVRPSYGRLPALLGLATLLFLPSQFAWSLSALKEPLYLLVTAVSLAAALTAGRPGPHGKRIAAVVLLVASAFAAQSIREGGLAMVGVGAVLGIGLGVMTQKPRLAVALVLACVLATPLIVTRAKFKDGVVSGVRKVATVHWGHVNTPGYVYTFLDGAFYTRMAAVQELTLGEGVRYVVGSIVSYVVVPLPWKIQSRAALTYLPEQVVWYLMVLLLPLGLAAGLRRDALLTTLLAAYATVAALLVAITGGNVGTLVRHRGLAVPYLLWFSVLGAAELLARRISSKQDTHADYR